MRERASERASECVHLSSLQSSMQANDVQSSDTHHHDNSKGKGKGNGNGNGSEVKPGVLSVVRLVSV